MKNAWSKMRGYLIRLSLILAVCRVAESPGNEAEEITAADVENAAILVEYFKGMARKAHGHINSFDTSSKVAYELISLLRDEGEIKATADELRQMLPSAPDTAEATSRLIERAISQVSLSSFRLSLIGRFEDRGGSTSSQTNVAVSGDVEGRSRIRCMER